MSQDQFRETLKRLGLSQAAFADLIGVHHNTVTAWIKGTNAVPGPVAAYLDLMLRVRALLPDRAPARQPGKSGRAAYQREFMRKKRADARNDKP